MMLISSTLLLSLSLPIFTHALPLDVPTNTTAPSSLFTHLPATLEERGHWGWLSSYAPTDPSCNGGWGGSRPKIQGDCITFSPISDHVGINWGTAPYKIGGLDAYRDDSCKIKVGETIDAPKTGRSCISVVAHSRGKGWGSVKYHEYV